MWLWIYSLGMEDNDRNTSHHNIRLIFKISNNFSYYYKVFDPIDLWFKLLKIGNKMYVKFVSHSTVKDTKM